VVQCERSRAEWTPRSERPWEKSGLAGDLHMLAKPQAMPGDRSGPANSSPASFQVFPRGCWGPSLSTLNFHLRAWMSLLKPLTLSSVCTDESTALPVTGRHLEGHVQGF
jgi:hypothetical protein